MTLSVIAALAIAIGVLTIVLVIGLAWLSMRNTQLEERQSKGPSHTDLAAIRDRVADLSGHMKALADRQSAATRAIETIQKHLLESERGNPLPTPCAKIAAW